EDAPADSPWTRHATGVLGPADIRGSAGQAGSAPGPADIRGSAGQAGSAPGPGAESVSFDLRVWPPAGAAPLAVEGLYERLADAGLGYGPEFQGLRAVWKRGDELFAEVQLPEGLVKEAGLFGLHPALLDAAFHALALEGAGGAGG